jgi:hypothetical protein
VYRLNSTILTLVFQVLTRILILIFINDGRLPRVLIVINCEEVGLGVESMIRQRILHRLLISLLVDVSLILLRIHLLKVWVSFSYHYLTIVVSLSHAWLTTNGNLTFALLLYDGCGLGMMLVYGHYEASGFTCVWEHIVGFIILVIILIIIILFFLYFLLSLRIFRCSRRRPVIKHGSARLIVL